MILKHIFHKITSFFRTEKKEPPIKDYVLRVHVKPKPEQQVELSPYETQTQVLNKLQKEKEKQICKKFMPEPKAKRLTHTHVYQAPAERHRDAISKSMKGKASARYLKTIKRSPNIKIEEKEDQYEPDESCEDYIISKEKEGND